MDLFEHRYYKLNKILLMLGGYWPYQSTLARYTRYVITIFILVSQAIPQVLALVKYRDDPTIFFECVTIFLYGGICITKGISLCWNVQKTLKLLNRIRTDWQVWARDREVNILHEYADQGRKMSILYTAVIYAAVIGYETQPIIPTIIDVLLRNGTAPRKFPFPVDYYHLDMQKYYWYIIMHIYVCMFTRLTLLVGTEVMLIIYVQHVCGIFAALGRKFHRIGDNISVKSQGSLYLQGSGDFPSCIDRHNDAINYANLIDVTYSWTILFVTGLGIILLNLFGLQILVKKSDPRATVRYIAVALGIILHIYVECEISEILMDHSISIHLYVQKSQWYNLAPEAQTSLPLMMMLCRVLCQLTAGHYVTLSMKSFGQTMRAAMSYFTLVRSMHM